MSPLQFAQEILNSPGTSILSLPDAQAYLLAEQHEIQERIRCHEQWAEIHAAVPLLAAQHLKHAEELRRKIEV